MMPRILLVICVTINIDDTLSDPLNALKICAHGIFGFLSRKASFILPVILDLASHGILQPGLEAPNFDKY